MLGLTFGGYTVERELGRGGMGAVFLGSHAILGRKAAIKVLLPEMSRDQSIVQRFFNEAKAATAINHPGIVDVHDFGVDSAGTAYIVMEFLQGESLATRLRREHKLSCANTLIIARQVASALAAAHRAGIVHRDLKPDNLFLVPDPEVSTGERIKVLDFGIAKLMGDSLGSNTALTRTGALMGTPLYMSPEQCRGATLVEARSDLYSLGCMMFEMVCGRVPFSGAGVGELIAAHIHVAPPRPASISADIAPELDAVILRLLSKLPEERPDSAEMLVAELAAIALGQRSSTSTVAPRVSGGQVATASTTVSTGRELAIVRPRPPAIQRRGVRTLVIGTAVGLCVVLFYIIMWFAM